MKQKSWFVIKEVCVWRFFEEYNEYLWDIVSHVKVSQDRRTMEEANADFERLGFELKSGPGVVVQCHDDIEPQKKWVRYIVQCKSY